MILTFTSIIDALLKVFFLIGVGVLISRKGWVSSGTTEFLTNLLVKVAVPCLIFATFIKNSAFFWKINIWFFVLASLCFFVLGLINSFFVFSFRKFNLRREFIMLVTFQNCGYLPMTLSFFLFPSEIHQKFLVFIFMYLLGFNILMWSWGTFFLSRKNLKDAKTSMFFTPPVITVIASFVMVYTGFDKWVPPIILDTAATLGKTTFVLSMLLLGIFLHQDADVIKSGFKRYAFLAAYVKLFLIPLEVFFILNVLEIDPLYKTFLMIQASMPSAASLPIVASWAKGNRGFMAQGVFLSNVLSILTIPLWLVAHGI